MKADRERIVTAITDAQRAAMADGVLLMLEGGTDAWARALYAQGVRVVDDPEWYDRERRDAEAERRFLQPINPDPVTPMAEAVRRAKR